MPLKTQIPEELKHSSIAAETANIYPISFEFQKVFKLYFINLFSWIFCCCKNRKPVLLNLYQMGVQKLNKDMNIEKLIKNLKRLRIYN